MNINQRRCFLADVQETKEMSCRVMRLERGKYINNTQRYFRIVKEIMNGGVVVQTFVKERNKKDKCRCDGHKLNVKVRMREIQSDERGGGNGETGLKAYR